MTTNPGDEHTFPSTTFEWRQVKIKRRPQGTSTVRAQRGRWRHLARWPRSQHLTLKITYRGGAESWWLVEARGSHGVFPGHASLEDVMSQVLNEPDYVADEAGDRERAITRTLNLNDRKR